MSRSFRRLLAPLTEPLSETRLSLWAWGFAALVSLTFAFVVAVLPGNSRDYLQVRSWLSLWQFGAVDPYAIAALGVDYPPHGLLLLSPLVWLPVSSGTVLVAVFNLLACTLAAWLMVGMMAELSGAALDRRQQLILAAIVLSFGAMRSAMWLGQSMPLALALAVMAVRESRRRPLLAGLCFGLASFKVNLAVGFGVALLLQPAILVLLVAGVAVLGVSWVFAASVHQPLYQLGSEYLHGMLSVYAGPGRVKDWLSVRAIVYDLFANAESAQALYYFVIAATLVVLVVACLRSRSRALGLATCLLWGVAVFWQQRFNAILAAPFLLLVLLPGAGVVPRSRWRPWCVAGLLVYFCLDVPLVLRLIGGRFGHILFFDPILVALYLTRFTFFGLFVFAVLRLLAGRRGGLFSASSRADNT
jgi:hypothetical protein